jgi:hypothetical protein
MGHFCVNAIDLVQEIGLVILPTNFFSLEDTIMSLRVLFLAAVAVSFTCAGSSFAQQVNRPEVSIQKLRNAAAQDAAQALTAFADSKKLAVAIVAEPVSNTVIVAGEAAQTKLVIDLLAKLDTPPARIQAQLLIMEVPAGFAEEIGLAKNTKEVEVWCLTERETRMLNSAIRKDKEVKILSRPQLLTCDNQTGVVSVGDMASSITLQLTPRVTPQGLLARIEAGVKKPDDFKTMQTTIKVVDGGTSVFRLPNPSGKEDVTTEMLAVITLHVVKN